MREEKSGAEHILHLSALQLWAMGGNAGMSCLQKTIEGHVKAGYRVTFIMPAYAVWNDGMVPASAPSVEGFDVYVAPCSWMPASKKVLARLKRLGNDGILPFALGWLFGLTRLTLMTASLLAAALKVRRLTGARFDLVYAHNQWAAPAGWFAARLFGVPNITRLYGTFLADLMKKPLVWLRYPIAAAGFLVPHDLLICANDGTRGDWVAKKLGIDEKRFRFWQDGVDESPCGESPSRQAFLRDAPSGLRPEAKWVVSCSRLSYWKRIDRMLRALRFARSEGADCQLLVAGDGPEREGLTALARELRVEEHVVWLGSVPHARVPELMALADVFMITNDVTNRCNPLFEAMRARLPVVSVRDPSTDDLLEDGDNAFLVDRDDAEALGKALAKVCTDAAAAARMRERQASKAGLLWNWQERMAVEIKELEGLLAAGRA